MGFQELERKRGVESKSKTTKELEYYINHNTRVMLCNWPKNMYGGIKFKSTIYPNGRP